MREAVRSNIDAGAALAELSRDGDTDARSRLADPARRHRRRRCASYYDEAEAATGIPWAYLAAIHLVETPAWAASTGRAPPGAQGPMQFIPATWASYGKGDINSNHDAIQAAARYLASRGGPDDMDRALFSYNNDDRYVAAVKDYAKVMLADPAAYDGYHEWQVFVADRRGHLPAARGLRGPGA